MIADRQQLREAFLAHRLNRAELVRATEAPDGAAFEELRDPAVDLRDEVAPERVDRAISELGLDREFRELDPDQVWTPYQRALYRRLSTPEHDPAEWPAEPSGPAKPGDAGLVGTVQAHFDEWDRNHDTRLETAELDRAMERPDLGPEESAALVVLRSFTEALGSGNPDDGAGVSTEDVALFAKGGLPTAPGLTDRINSEFGKLRDRAAGMEPAPPLAEESKDPGEIRQNRVGSCVLLSTTAGLDEAQVADLVTEAPDGSARVAFRDGEEELVYELTTAERLFHASGEAGARWPGLLEVAMGQRLARKTRSADSARSAADGVPPEEAILALTGRETARVSLDEISLNEARRQLADVCSRPGPRLCGSRPAPILKEREYDVEALHNGIQNSHAYTLVGFDAATDTVTLRNPWHRGPWLMASDPGETGVFEMPAAQFYASFRWIASPVA